MASNRHTAVSASREDTADRPIPAEVLDATRAAVLAVGVRRTTLTDVARRAGVSRMTLYRLVPDVTTLILAVMTREFATVFREAEQQARRRRTGRARAVAAMVEVVRRLPEAQLFQRVVDVDPELLLPYLTDRLGATQRLAVGQVRRMLSDGVADGSIRRGDLDTLAVTAVLVATPFVVSARLLDDDARAAALGELARMLDSWLAS
ncbi:MAG TPA: TetR/AcrR family transcriptional regulator [Mycobacteriales bacterium]|jgi:AcrR family transcriptional regulator|nr:TetR/AcrR family transcriptional regulator [Mycobacteriales bacterium]